MEKYNSYPEIALDSAMTRKIEQNRQKLISINYYWHNTILWPTILESVDDNIKNHKGNFKALIEFRISIRDQILKMHFKTATKSTIYIKTTQN